MKNFKSLPCKELGKVHQVDELSISGAPGALGPTPGAPGPDGIQLYTLIPESTRIEYGTRRIDFDISPFSPLPNVPGAILDDLG